MLNKVIVFPTDTVYGVGASIYDKKSISKIYEIKGRDFNKPIAVLCSSIKQMEEFAVITDEARKIGEAFWPGGLTLILKTNEKYFNFSGEKTIGVRIPNHKLALNLISEYGPLKTTSINKSGEEPLNDYEIIKNVYGNVIDDIYENNEKISRISSTVIDLTNNLNIIRLGDITIEMINEVLKK